MLKHNGHNNTACVKCVIFCVKRNSNCEYSLDKFQKTHYNLKWNDMISTCAGFGSRVLGALDREIAACFVKGELKCGIR